VYVCVCCEHTHAAHARAPANDLLYKGAAHDGLEGGLLVAADEVLVDQVL
jgi:hypothetical protein